MTTVSEPATPALGHAILECLRGILKRCAEANVRLDFPGEGGERPFRGWLVSDLLIKLLGWPAEKLVVGEIFDILLQDANGFPVVTIETKTPYHKASKKEREGFESRLSGYGTLRTAYFTNGAEWERLDIFAPTGVLDIRGRLGLHLDVATTEEVEAFFTPLVASRHFQTAIRSSRHAVSRENPHILESLAADLDQAIGDLALPLNVLFAGLREGQAGEQTREVTIALFNLWCEKSLIVSPRKAAEQLTTHFKKEDLTPREIEKAIADLGLTGIGATKAAEELSSLPKARRQDVGAVLEAMWPAYELALDKLCAQTAHVILARALLYRIGEDQNVFPRVLSGEEMERTLVARVPALIEVAPPAVDLLSRVRLSMQAFLPTVYQLGEFDWWLVPADKRAVLNSVQRAWLRQMDAEFDLAIQRLLRMLDGYFFGRVDVDVWRNVYQHYLPAEERQRLGGFYTPDELIHLILDLSGYTPEREGLCELSVIDPACGSGAFVTGALARLLEHLKRDMPCHESLLKRGMPDWKRAEYILNNVTDRLHGVDIHPFAAFLTTLNVLFLLLPLYAKVREKNQDFSLDLQVFSADSLEKPDAQLLQPDLFASLNSRVQLTEDSYHRYQKMLEKRFDRVFGNPPWGGVLKGQLAPVYDTVKKQRFAREFPAATQGKYDVYALFMERALQILKPGGRFGLVTQGSFIDKEWASELRQLLAVKSSLRYVVDLNPFGQLFFHAMNIPCVTVADNVAADAGECTALLSARPTGFQGLGENERRQRVIAIVRKTLSQIAQGQNRVSVDFASAARISYTQLRETAKDRWSLSGTPTAVKLPRDWYAATDLLEVRQGVTPGGCLDIFLMAQTEAQALGLEDALVHLAIKSKKIARWRVMWTGQVLFYPYRITDSGAVPAFTLDLRQLADQELAETIRRLGVKDALDFDKQLDARELEIVRQKGVNRASVEDLLKHRIALGLIQYPKAARYLTQHYDRLAGRIFEKKRFTAMGKCWYEYHRPRDPEIMLGRVRIVSPTLVQHVRFALDTVGYLSDHACLFLQPTAKTNKAWEAIRKQLTDVVGQEVTNEDALKYCLAFLNSSYAQERLTTGHRPRPGDVYAVTESVLHEIPIPPPQNKKIVITILDLVSKLITETNEREIVSLEDKLAVIVNRIMKPVA